MLSPVLSVRLSYGLISQKRLKLGSCNFHHSFCDLSLTQKFWRVPPDRGVKQGWGEENKLFSSLCVDISKTVQDTTNVTRPTDEQQEVA